jgi:ABC-2 type transport system ATP-binding protein
MNELDVDRLTKRYATTLALDAVSFTVRGGELFAYLGPNGSGKTTTIRILNGLSRPTSGRVNLDGSDLLGQGRRARTHFGLVPQSINLDRDLRVVDNLDLHGRYFGVPKKMRKKRIAELLEYVGLAKRAASPVKNLSGGLQRRVMIIRALVHEPKILFLDEPTVGLDPAMRRQIWALIKQIQHQGTTVFLTTHYIEEAEFLADRVALLCEGKVVATDEPANLISRLGRWAVDRYAGGKMQSHYYDSRREAIETARARGDGFQLRRINLEDAYLRLTGKRVAP